MAHADHEHHRINHQYAHDSSSAERRMRLAGHEELVHVSIETQYCPAPDGARA